jgi:TPP-dependent pyruvate/acetoin dehydrogenase alpha subunit
MASRTSSRGRSAARPRVAPAPAAPSASLDRAQKLDLYYYMRLTRSLEERLVNLYRQTKVIGGLFRT